MNAIGFDAAYEMGYAVGTMIVPLFVIGAIIVGAIAITRSVTKSGNTGASGASSAPGWYPDPEVQRQLRYWDGLNWTEHRAPQ
jgi:hypothetical protein